MKFNGFLYGSIHIPPVFCDLRVRFAPFINDRLKLIQHFIEECAEKYHILEIAYDRWNATMLVTNLMEEGLTMVQFGQGYKDMSPACKEFYKVLMQGRMVHGGNPVRRWMAGNVVIETDDAGNIKLTKAKSKEKIDGIVATVMALDRCVRHEAEQQESVYESRGLLIL